MFLGQFEANFSGQGRIILPKKFREELKGETSIILSRGIDGGVWGFSRSDWEVQAKQQLEIAITDERGRNLRRFLFSGAEVVDLDCQGRVVIPRNLLGFAKIKNGVVIIGAGDHFEIWDSRFWRQLMVKLVAKVGANG